MASHLRQGRGELVVWLRCRQAGDGGGARAVRTCRVGNGRIGSPGSMRCTDGWCRSRIDPAPAPAPGDSAADDAGRMA